MGHPKFVDQCRCDGNAVVLHDLPHLVVGCGVFVQLYTMGKHKVRS